LFLLAFIIWFANMPTSVQSPDGSHASGADSTVSSAAPAPRPLTAAEQHANRVREARQEAEQAAAAAKAEREQEAEQRQAERQQEEQQREQEAEQQRQARWASTHYQNDGLILDKSSVRWTDDGSGVGGGYMTGTVENDSGNYMDYAQITFKELDSDGDVIGTAMTNITHLSADATWRFKCPIDDGTKRVKLDTLQDTPFGEDGANSDSGGQDAAAGSDNSGN
jgi:flagellar biosynthesis GTPase FlhF